MVRSRSGFGRLSPLPASSILGIPAALDGRLPLGRLKNNYMIIIKKVGVDPKAKFGVLRLNVRKVESSGHSAECPIYQPRKLER